MEGFVPLRSIAFLDFITASIRSDRSFEFEDENSVGAMINTAKSATKMQVSDRRAAVQLPSPFGNILRLAFRKTVEVALRRRR